MVERRKRKIVEEDQKRNRMAQRGGSKLQKPVGDCRYQMQGDDNEKICDVNADLLNIRV